MGRSAVIEPFLRDSGIPALRLGRSGCAEGPHAPSRHRMRVKTGSRLIILKFFSTLHISAHHTKEFIRRLTV